jgi:hypothetical protein
LARKVNDEDQVQIYNVQVPNQGVAAHQKAVSGRPLVVFSSTFMIVPTLMKRDAVAVRVLPMKSEGISLKA